MLYGKKLKKKRRNKKKQTNLAESIFQSAYFKKSLVILLVLASIIGFLIGSKRFVAAQSKFQTDLAVIKFTGGQIYWASQKARDLIRKSLDESVKENLPAEKLSLTDSEVISKVHKAFQSSPWVKNIWSINKEYPNTINAQFELRKPAVAVLVEDKIMMVDENNIILPLIFTWKIFEDFNSQLKPRLKTVIGLNVHLIENAEQGVVVETDNDQILFAGNIWDDERISAAISLNKSIRKYENKEAFKYLDFKFINARNVNGKIDKLASELLIEVVVKKTVKSIPNQKPWHTFTICWGREEKHAGFGENTDEQKFSMLKRIIANNHDVRNISKLDLRFSRAEWAPVYKN